MDPFESFVFRELVFFYISWIKATEAYLLQELQ